MNEQVTAGPTELSWDPETRTATLRFLEEGKGGRAEAETLVAHLWDWIDAPEPEHFFLLVDCSSIVDVDAGWRAVWAEQFKRHRDAATVAWFNATPWIRLIILMFKKGTGVQGEVFTDEAEARRWLQTGDAAP